MPSATLVFMTFLPLNLAISTFLSAATIIHVAFSISSFVSLFLTPAEPLVSTFIDTPLFSAILFKLSAAINVCAIPVGHAVTAKTLGYLLASFSLVSIIFFSATFSS